MRFLFFAAFAIYFHLERNRVLLAIPAVSFGRFIISYCDPMVYVAFAVMRLPVRLLPVQVRPIFTMLFTIYAVKAIRSAPVRARKRTTNVSILKIWNAILLYSGEIVCAYYTFASFGSISFIFYLSHVWVYHNFNFTIFPAHLSRDAQ